MRAKRWLWFFALLWAPALLAQGRTDYFNTETVQVDPLAIVSVGGRQFLAVVNTPDNSVELYHTEETLPIGSRFIARVRTGLEPNSLLWVPQLSRLYVTNALSDSVTIIRLDPGDTAGVVATVERTDWVGDEPVSLAYHPFEEDDGAGGTVLRHSLFLAHRDQDALGWRDALTLQPIIPGAFLFDATVPKGDIDQDGQNDLIALKSPRDVDVHCGKLFLLGEKGGNTQHFDFDLYSLPTAGGAAADLALPNSANFHMTWGPGDDLFIVGGEALNTTLRDEAVVAAAPTGFVKSTFTMVRGLCSGTPTFKVRDVNLEPALQPLVAPGTEVFGSFVAHKAALLPAMQPVPKTKALAQLTGVATYRGSSGPLKVFFTALSSDRVGVIEPDWSSSADSWLLRRIAMAPVPGSVSPVAGPRGLVIKGPDAGNPNDPGPRLYVLNRLDNSVTILNPVTETSVGQFALRHDPTPDHIKAGRTFLYSAEHGNGFNSCSSCHIDGRTDGLAWDLGDGVQVPIDPQLKDSLLMPSFWPADKEHMVTQSLQGLLNFDVGPEIQDLFTNAPYHWRGDREDFTQFKPAFVSLLAGTGITDDEMEGFREFINSVNYPPNPRQPLGRVFSGEPFVDETFPPPLPTGAQAGLTIYHLIQSDLLMSCAHCHALPEGSNNKITERVGGTNPADHAEELATQPIETAALRGLFQKEARLTRAGTVDPDGAPITGLEGLFHTGFILKDPLQTNTDFNRTSTINAFDRHFFGGVLCPPGLPFCPTLQQLNQFIHELDWGVGPLVGIAYTVDLANLADPLTTTAFGLAEDQTRKANNGLAVQAHLGATDRGFWFDPGASLFVEEPPGASLTRVQLTSLLGSTNDRLVLVVTPLGSERRVAAPSGQPSPSAPGAPSGVVLQPIATNTAYATVPKMTLNWQDPADNQHGGFFSHTVRLFQAGVVASAPAGESAFGTAVRWEAPRRLRVAANGILPGARLVLFSHDDPAAVTPPDLTKRPNQPGQVLLRSMSLPIHPTGDVDPVTGRPIWETAAELDPREYLRLILGGPFAPSVSAAFTDNGFLFQEVPLDPALAFDAANWNWHYVRVENPNGQRGDGGWQRLRLK